MSERIKEMALEEEIKEKKKEYRTDSYAMSYGEIISMYRNNEIDINPEFQRYYRWSQAQKTRFIESILLGIPTPSVFVYQREDGIWELVDGLQRISTVLEFVGELKLKDENGNDRPPLKLEGTEILPSLEGIMWKNPPERKFSLPNSLQLDLKRSKIIVQIIQKASDPEAKYEVFQRINTGGSFLSEQEVRNCLLIMMNRDLYYWIKNLADNEHFLNCISLSDRLMQEQYNMELVLRYLSCFYYKYEKKEVAEFLTDSLNKISKDKNFNFKEEEMKFLKLFGILNNSLGDKVFTKFDGKSFKGKFLESSFEAMTIGLRYNLDSYKDRGDEKIVIDKIKRMWITPDFLDYSGSGSNAKIRIPKLIAFGKKFYKNGKEK